MVGMKSLDLNKFFWEMTKIGFEHFTEIGEERSIAIVQNLNYCLMINF